MNDTYYRDYDDTLDPKSTNIKSGWESVLFKYKGIKRYRDDIHDEVCITLLNFGVCKEQGKAAALFHPPTFLFIPRFGNNNTIMHTQARMVR